VEARLRLGFLTVTLLGMFVALRYECSVCSGGWLRLCEHARTAREALEVALKGS